VGLIDNGTTLVDVVTDDLSAIFMFPEEVLMIACVFARGLAMMVVCSVCGCLSAWGPSQAPPQPPSPFLEKNPIRTPPVIHSPATLEMSAKVDSMTRKITAANPQIGFTPMVMAVGVQQPMLFHRGTREIFISEGVIKKCKDEGELAAVLCFEMGRMVSEREASSSLKSRSALDQPPMEFRMQPDVIGGGSGDVVRQMELARFEQSRMLNKQPLDQRLPPPDPGTLAQSYLTRTGYPAEHLLNVTPLIQSARNSDFERQITNQPAPTRPVENFTQK
jgi:hypothetical protein